MRYVSLVLVVGFMWWTWALANQQSPLSEQTHIGIQEDLQRVITEYIEENIPGAADIRFDRFWTQSMGPNKVKATFSYSFEDKGSESLNAVRIGIDGFAILNRIPSENNEYDVWSMDELNVLNNKIEFKDGIEIHN